MALCAGIFLIFAGACSILQVGNSESGVEPCVFPFTYHGHKYFDCTFINSIFRWCSLDPEYSKRWKFCRWEDRATCVIPFKYKGTTYNECTKDGSIFSNAWCSLTDNYDRDGAWKHCST